MLGMGGHGIPDNITVSTVTAGSFTVTGSTIPTNGLYLPAANTVGIATNGTLRVSVSTTAVSVGLNTIVGSTSVAPDGTLHAHTATAGSVTAQGNADDLVIENSAAGGLSILTPDASLGAIYWGAPTSNLYASIQASYNSSSLFIATNKVGSSLVLRGDNGVTNLTLNGASGSELATFVRNIVSTNGNLTLSAGDLIITTPTTPAASSSTGTIGTIAWDTGFLYVCTATDTWERVAIATW